MSDTKFNNNQPAWGSVDMEKTGQFPREGAEKGQAAAYKEAGLVLKEGKPSPDAIEGLIDQRLGEKELPPQLQDLIPGLLSGEDLNLLATSPEDSRQARIVYRQIKIGGASYLIIVHRPPHAYYMDSGGETASAEVRSIEAPGYFQGKASALIEPNDPNYLAGEIEEEKDDGEDKHPPLKKWEVYVLRLPLREQGLPFWQAYGVTSVGAELEGPIPCIGEFGCRALPPAKQKELQQTMREIAVPKGGTALALLGNEIIALMSEKTGTRPLPASWTQVPIASSPAFFSVNSGEYTEYVQKIQHTLYEMIKDAIRLSRQNEKFNNTNNPYQKTLKLWEALVQKLRYENLETFLAEMEKSGVELGFLYFSAHHVHVGIPENEEGYPTEIFFKVADALNDPFIASSMLLTTASTPAAYGEWLQTPDGRFKIDARYALAGILPTTQRFTKRGYATNQKELMEIFRLNTRWHGANTLDRMTAYNEDFPEYGFPVMHGMLRMRPVLGTIEFTGASSADPLSTTVYAMMAEMLVMGATMGIDLKNAFGYSETDNPLIQSLAQGRKANIYGNNHNIPEHWQKENFFQDMLTLPTNAEELKQKIEYLDTMKQGWQTYFDALKQKIEEEAETVSVTGSTDQIDHIQATKKQIYWYMQEVLEQFERLRNGYVLAFILNNPGEGDLLKQILYEEESSALGTNLTALRPWLQIIDSANYQEIAEDGTGSEDQEERSLSPSEVLEYWMQNNNIPIWTLWYVLKARFNMTPQQIEELIGLNTLEMYQNTENILRQKFASWT